MRQLFRQGVIQGREDRADIPATLFAKLESDRAILEILQEKGVIPAILRNI